MLPQFGSAAMSPRLDAAKLDRTVHHAAAWNLRMLDRRERTDRMRLRIVENFCAAADRCPDQMMRVKNRRPFISSFGDDHAIDLGGQSGAIFRTHD